MISHEDSFWHLGKRQKWPITIPNFYTFRAHSLDLLQFDINSEIDRARVYKQPVIK